MKTLILAAAGAIFALPMLASGAGYAADGKNHDCTGTHCFPNKVKTKPKGPSKKIVQTTHKKGMTTTTTCTYGGQQYCPAKPQP